MTVGNIQNGYLRRAQGFGEATGMTDSYANYRLLSEKMNDKTEFKGKNVSFGALPGNAEFWKKLFDKFADGISDLNLAYVTAVGTAFVAPIFIVFNPIAEYFNKRQPADPKDTRTPEQKEKDNRNQRIYSAWRQPVSAIIALGGQFILTKPIEKILDNAAAKGHFNVTPETSELHSKFNIINHDDYYKTKAQDELKRENAELSYENITARKKKIIERVKQDELERILKEEPELIDSELKKLNPKEPTTYSVLVDDSLKKSVGEDLERDKEFMKTVKHRDNPKFKAEVKRIANLRVKKIVDIEEKVINEWRRIVLAGTTDKNEILKQLEQSDVVKGLKEAADSEATRNIIKKTVESVAKYDGKMKEFFLKATDLKTAVLQNKFVRAALDYTKAHYKNRRLLLTIFGNFITLPITCTILNWAFPKIANRIMGVNNPKAKKQTTKVDETKKEPVEEIKYSVGEKAVGKAGV